jgi:hypothetical protein
MAYNPTNPNGQATMANSEPVVIASNQSAIPITDNAGSLTVDGTVAVSNFPATQPVSGTVALDSTSLSALESITVQNAAGASAVNIQDGGNSITVDGSVSVSNFPATQAVSGPLTDTQLRATAVPISGTVSTGLTQPLTDTQLRATAVPVSGPLTDAQIRATALPISGTVTANAGTGTQNVSVQNASLAVTGAFFQATQPVSGTIELGATSLTALETISVANFPSTQAVSGPLTDTQLRATAVPISAASLPLPTGAATETTLSSLNTKVPSGLTVTTGRLQVELPAGGTGLTDTELRATPVPISGTITANAGTGTMNVSVQNASIPVTDNGGSLTVDGTVTANAGTGTFATSDANAVSQATATAAQKGYLSLAGATATLPTYISGNTNAMTMTTSGLLRVDGSNVTQPVSGTVTADTELPAATALGDSTANPTAPHVGSCIEAFNGTSWDRIRTDTALAGTAANNTVVGVLAAGIGPGFAVRFNPANLGTAANSTSVIDVDGATTVTVAIGTTTTGTFILEASGDGTNFFSVEAFDATQDLWVTSQNLTPTAGRTYHLVAGGLRQIRLRTVTTLGATVAHFVNLSLSQQVIAGIDTGAPPHNFGYTIVHKDGEYTTAQTTTALWTPTTGKKFTVTDITISTGGTTSGIVTVFDSAAATAYSAGTTPAIFRGEFAPSATAKPGAVKSFNVPYCSTTVNNRLHVTTSAAMTVYIQLNGYEI